MANVFVIAHKIHGFSVEMFYASDTEFYFEEKNARIFKTQEDANYVLQRLIEHKILDKFSMPENDVYVKSISMDVSDYLFISV